MTVLRLRNRLNLKIPTKIRPSRRPKEIARRLVQKFIIQKVDFLPNDARPEYSKIKHVTSVGNSLFTQYSWQISLLTESIYKQINSKLTQNLLTSLMNTSFGHHPKHVPATAAACPAPLASTRFAHRGVERHTTSTVLAPGDTPELVHYLRERVV